MHDIVSGWLWENIWFENHGHVCPWNVVQVFIFFPPIIANEVRETQATQGEIGLLIKGKGYSSHDSSQDDEMQSTLQPDFFTLFEESSLCLTTESDCIYVSYKPSDSIKVVGNFFISFCYIHHFCLDTII